MKTSFVNDDVTSMHDEIESQGKMISSRNARVKELKQDILSKTIMIKQLKIEMEKYATEKMQLEEKNGVLEQTVNQLTNQIVILTSSENVKSQQIKNLTFTSEKSKSPVSSSKKPKSFAQTSFLLPAPDSLQRINSK